MEQVQDWELQELLALSRAIGWGAADILRDMHGRELSIQQESEGPVTAADLAVNAYILNNLQASLGTQDFGYLTEETYKTQNPSDRLSQTFVWVIDPLDGTKDFIQGTGEYAIHIALVQGDYPFGEQRSYRPILAVVACPAVETLYFATLNGGTFVEHRNGVIRPVRVSDRNQLAELTVVASRSHRNQRFNQLLQRFPCQKQRQVGSIGGKIAAILEQQADVYIALSGTSAPKDWDLAAPELILTEAGGQFTHFDRTPLQYNQPDVTQWGGLLASNGPCHEGLCTAAERILAELD